MYLKLLSFLYFLIYLKSQKTGKVRRFIELKSFERCLIDGTASQNQKVKSVFLLTFDF